MEETDTNPSDGQRTMLSHMTPPDSTHSQSLTKGDSLLTSAASSTPHSRATDKTISTIPYGRDTYRRELSQSRIFTLSTDTSTGDCKNSEVHNQVASASLDIISCSEPPYKAMIRSHDKLVAALSIDPLSITNILVTNKFEILNEILSRSTSMQEKATRLVIAITEKIKLVPN